MKAEIIVALDYPDESTALAFVDRVQEECNFFKIGLELFAATGPKFVSELRARGCRIFLDLKLHDIPNTVKGAARSISRLGCEITTVHASGGSDMLAAAREGAESGGSDAPCKVFGVSVLTSLDAAGLGRAWGRVDALDVSAEVSRLAGLCADAGLAGLVCSSHEASEVRKRFGGRLELLVPGIRLEPGARAGDVQAHDQVRIATPRTAAEAGADYLILGRAVTASADPGQVLRQVREALR